MSVGKNCLERMSIKAVAIYGTNFKDMNRIKQWILYGVIYRLFPNYKPILSRYISFGTREILYESKAGKRKLIMVHRGFSEPFPIETTNFLTYKEMQEALKNGI